MSVVAFLLGMPRKGTRITREILNARGDKVLASIMLDATLKEDFSAPSEITKHPTSHGPHFSDHIILHAQTLRITGVISETPFSMRGQAAGIASVLASQAGQRIGGAVTGGSIVGSAIGGVAATALAAKSLAGLLTPPSVTLERGADGRERFRDVEDNERQERADSNLPGQNTRMRDAVNEFLLIRDARVSVNIVTGLKLYKDFVMTEFDVIREVVMGKSLQVSLVFEQLLFANPADSIGFTPVARVAQKKVAMGSRGLNQLAGGLAQAAGNAFSKIG